MQRECIIRVVECNSINIASYTRSCSPSWLTAPDAKVIEPTSHHFNERVSANNSFTGELTQLYQVRFNWVGLRVTR